MVFRWLNHPTMRGDEQLMAMLYDLGMATKRQLLVITGWSNYTLDWRLKQIRSRADIPEERDQWVRSYPVPRQKRLFAYVCVLINLKLLGQRDAALANDI